MADTQTASAQPSGSLPPDMLNPPDSTLISGLQPPTAPQASLPQSMFDPVVANLGPAQQPAAAPPPAPQPTPAPPQAPAAAPAPQPAAAPAVPQVQGHGQPLPSSQVPPGANTSASAPNQWRAVGDSIAHGYQKFGGAGGTGVDLDPNNRSVDAAGGRPPQVVLDYLKSLPDGAMNGQNIIFSTGVSNDPNQINLVPEQLAQLKRLGAANVKVVGVGDQVGQEGGHQYNLAPYNATLQKDATDAGYTFGGALPAVVHPAPDYYRHGLTAPQPQGTGKTIDDVTAYIQKSEGGGSFILYGHEGQPYDPNNMKTKPGYYGFPDWAGATTSRGPTHAAGGAQWEPDTWKNAVDGFVGAGLANKLGHTPDFRNEADQKAVFNYWADRRYRELTGRDIVADMNAGHVDWAALGPEWESLKYGGGGGGGMTASNLPGYQEWQRAIAEQQRIGEEGLADMQKRLAKMEAGSPEQRALSDQMLQKMMHVIDLKEQQIAHPPTMKPHDMISNFGSIATLIGIFGGRFANRPMVASLNAAGAAMEAINNNDRQAYEDQFKIWKTTSDMTDQLLGQEASVYKSIMEDKRASQEEQFQQMEAAMKIYQNQQGLAAAAAANYPEMWKIAQQVQDTHQKLQLTNAQIRQADAKASESQTKQQTEATTQAIIDQAVEADVRAFTAAHKDATPDELAQARADSLAKRLTQMKPKSASAGSLEASKMLQVVDGKTGKVIDTFMGRERRDQPGWLRSDDGSPVKIEPGQEIRQITPTTAGGGRAGAQVLRQLVGGSEVRSDLQNVVTLPVGTTIGPLGTVHTGPSITGAVTGDLTRVLTSQEAQLMQASMAGLTRELSILMSPVYGGNYAAQQLDPLVPKTGDTLQTVIFKLARIAQSADNALEAAGKSPLLSNDEQQYATELRGDIKQAISWTSAEAQAFALRGKKFETFGDFVTRSGINMPDWAARSATSPDGKKIFADPQGNWFDDQHKPYQPAQQ